MADEIKAPVAPDVKVEAPADEPIIDNRRLEIEKRIITENETIPDPIPDDEEVTPPVEKKEEVKSEEEKEEKEEDPLDRIKKSVQKRIDKVVAKQKSAEDRLAEAEAELARLRANPKTEVIADKKTDDTPPTIEQVEAYIVKMAEEGNKKEEIAATRYLIKLEKDAAIKEVEDRQNKVRHEADEKVKRENDALIDLAKDYVVLNEKGEADLESDLTLANQKGLLFRTTMALYNDPELHRDFYSDPDRPTALRRATADAYREIHQQGLIRTPKVDSIESPRRTPRVALADPDATQAEESPSQSNSNLLSDAEKVREEIKFRNKNRVGRKVS